MKRRWVMVIGLFSSLFAGTENLAEGPLNWNDPKWSWMDQQISEDFLSFERKGISKPMVDGVLMNALNILPHTGRFKIQGGKVVGPGDGEIFRLLEQVAELYPIPDLEVVICGADSVPNPGRYPGPILVTCKEQGLKNDNQILFPCQCWEMWRHFAQEVEKTSLNSPWEIKVPKYFWRGKPNDGGNYYDKRLWTVHRRGKLCYWSLLHPELIDAAFSSYWEESLGNMVQEFFEFFPKRSASWEEHIGHKYLIDIDGTVACTPGFAWRLLSNCAVFKQDSRAILWFHQCVKPGVHYIPIKEDLSDLFIQLSWAKEHDAEAKQIAENGREFAKNNLLPKHLYLYCFKVLLKYASLYRP